MNPTELHCYRPRQTSDCDETLMEKLKASLNFNNDSADVAKTEWGWTVFRTTPSGMRWVDVTYRTKREATLRAKRINDAKESR